jgi:hypothetical protein
MEDIIDSDFLLSFGFEQSDFITYELKISAIKLICCQNAKRFYFQLPGLYIGQIVKQEQFLALYYGISGRKSHILH